MATQQAEPVSKNVATVPSPLDALTGSDEGEKQREILRRFLAERAGSKEPKPLAQLARFRELKERIERMMPKRNALILEAIEEGKSLREIAIAAGFGGTGRVSQIVKEAEAAEIERGGDS